TRRLPILDELLAELEKGSVPVIEEVQTDEWMDVHEIPAETAADVDFAAELERAILRLRPFHIVKPAKRPEREEPATSQVPSETVDPSGGVDMLEEFRASLELPSEEGPEAASELWMPLSFGPAPMWPSLECRAAEPPPESFDAPADFIDEFLALPDAPSPAHFVTGALDLFDVAKDAFEPLSIVAQPPAPFEDEATSEFERVP